MKKTMKRSLAIILALALLLTAMAGCGGQSNSSTSGDAQSSTGEASGTDTNSGDEASAGALSASEFARNGVGDTKYGAGEFLKYDEPVSYSIGRVYDPNGSGEVASAEVGQPFTNNAWTSYHEDEQNIVVNYDDPKSIIVPNSTDYNQQILLAMSSGGLPDIFEVYDLSVLKQLSEAGAIADLTQVYKDNVNATLRDLIEYEGTDIYNPVSVDDKIMAIPTKMPSTNGYNHCWVRQDWLDELGLERPTTMQDVHDIAKAFVDHYDDNIGLMLNKDYIAESKGIFWAFGGTTAVRKYWQVLDDGTVGFSEVQPEMKGGLGWLRDMYAEGLVNKEFATQDIATAFEYVANNQCGIFFAPHWYAFRMQPAEESMDPTANWITCGLPTGIEGETTKVYATNTFDFVYCVNANYDHPELLVQDLNAYAEKLFGEENDFGNFFASPENSGFWGSAPMHVLHPLVDLDPHIQMVEALPDDAPENLVGRSRDYWNDVDLDESLSGVGLDYWNYINNGLSAYQYMFGPIDSCFSFVNKTYPDIVTWNAYYGAPTPTWADRWSSMQELIDTTYLQIIQGQVDLDQGFDSMVEQWNSIGGEAVTKEVNEIYSTY